MQWMATKARLRCAAPCGLRHWYLYAQVNCVKQNGHDIDLDAAEWRYTVTKTNTPHIVPLAKQALDILRELHPLTGRGRFVFPSARSNQRPMSDNAILAAMRRMGIGKG